MIPIILVTAAFMTALIVSRRTVKRELLRARRNRFREFTRVLFLSRRTIATFLLIESLDVVRILWASQASSGQHIQRNFAFDPAIHAAVGTDPNPMLILLIFIVGSVPTAGYAWARRSGLLRDLMLTGAPIQALFTPLLWKVFAAVGIASCLKAALFFVLGQTIQPYILPLYMARQLALVWMWVTFAFCAANHNFGINRLISGAVLLFIFTELLLAPAQLIALGWSGAVPIAQVVETGVYVSLGNLFYVSFLRTPQETWDGIADEPRTALA